MRRREFLAFSVARRWRGRSPRARNSGDAGDRVSRRQVARRVGEPSARISQGLKEAGYVEGENVAIEYRWCRKSIERLPDAGGRVGSPKVAVIATAAILLASAGQGGNNDDPYRFSLPGTRSRLVLSPALPGRAAI